MEGKVKARNKGVAAVVGFAMALSIGMALPAKVEASAGTPVFMAVPNIIGNPGRDVQKRDAEKRSKEKEREEEIRREVQKQIEDQNREAQKREEQKRSEEQKQEDDSPKQD